MTRAGNGEPRPLRNAASTQHFGLKRFAPGGRRAVAQADPKHCRKPRDIARFPAPGGPLSQTPLSAVMRSDPCSPASHCFPRTTTGLGLGASTICVRAGSLGSADDGVRFYRGLRFGRARALGTHAAVAAGLGRVTQGSRTADPHTYLRVLGLPRRRFSAGGSGSERGQHPREHRQRAIHAGAAFASSRSRPSGFQLSADQAAGDRGCGRGTRHPDAVGRRAARSADRHGSDLDSGRSSEQ